MQQFLSKLVNDKPVAYGDEIEDAIKQGAVDILLLSERLDEGEIDHLYEKTRKQGGSVEILSDEFEEGYQLLRTFKGKAAVLRYKLA
jgi:peptide subunit release factor 1 (eRF1)